ncbi:putative hemolysin activator protein [Yersinia frederiksenii]|uniref:ShlB/FhaC/HecB family hemolysin secretion/activation protein n=1 Tax=Yersinia frederiksenii TaxID=29484 RepID=UPI0005DE0785|nr:putative hemolysin activator protein [Yersinia frederiksenii]
MGKGFIVLRSCYLNLLAGVLLPMVAIPHASYGAELAPIQQSIHQQERQRALEERLAPAIPDVRLSAPSTSLGRLSFPAEKPCFAIDRIKISGAEPLPRWLPLQRIANQAQGQCLGAKGINLLMSQLQNRLVDHGYITTRVLAPQQDLNSGTLALQIVPGKIRSVELTPDSDRHVTLFSAFPARPGNLLDLRDIEQGLENLQRLPTVQASMELIPGTEPGETDIALSWKQSKMWRLAASLDDSGTRSTGRYQGGATLFLDNPLSLSDQFYVSAGGSIKNRGEKGTNNLTGHYSLPFGYWTAGLTASSYDYHQTVAGLNGDYGYRGESENVSLQLSRLLHRNASQKTTVTYDVLTRSSKNYINDTEVEVQRRRTSAWRVGLQHRHFIAQSTLDAGISYQRGTRWFGAVPAQEEYFGEATALSKILRMNAQWDIPFAIQKQNFHYNLQYQRQTTNTPLTPQDQFSIGGRWTVRGFDGERTLNADRGWTVRNDLGWYTPLPGHELYVGVDYGEVGGRSDPYLLGQHLAGSVVGVRGRVFHTQYDLFAGKPLSKPDGFKTDSVTLGFNLNWQY